MLSSEYTRIQSRQVDVDEGSDEQERIAQIVCEAVNAASDVDTAYPLTSDYKTADRILAALRAEPGSAP